MPSAIFFDLIDRCKSSSDWLFIFASPTRNPSCTISGKRTRMITRAESEVQKGVCRSPIFLLNMPRDILIFYRRLPCGNYNNPRKGQKSHHVKDSLDRRRSGPGGKDQGRADC